jgi:hypothetical protein
MKIINEREQMKNWIAISESQQLDEGLMQVIMAPFKFLGGAMSMVWNIVKGVVKILGFIIEYSGKATMLVSAPVSWISRALTILFRALAGTGHFMNEFGKDIRRFLESENLDADAIMEEKGDVEQMIRDIHDAIKDLNVRTSDETKSKFAQMADPENEESLKMRDLMAMQLHKMIARAPKPKQDPVKQEPNVSPSGQPLEPGTLKPLPGDLK